MTLAELFLPVRNIKNGSPDFFWPLKASIDGQELQVIFFLLKCLKLFPTGVFRLTDEICSRI